MNVKIEIDTKTFVRFWLVVIGFALTAMVIYSAKTALMIILTSLFLAIALSPPVKWLAGRLPGRSRVGATAIAYAIVMTVLLGFVFLVVPPIIEQTAHFAQTIPSFVEGLTSRWSGLDDIIVRYGMQEQVATALDSIQENAASWANNIGSTFISGVGSLISVFAAMLIGIFMTFFMLIEGPAWIDRLWSVYLDKNRLKHHKRVAVKMYRVVTSYVNGQLLVAMIAATLSGLVIFVLSLILDVPANIAIPASAIVFLGSLIPMFGATIAGIVIGLLLAFNDITAAIVYVVYFVIYQQVENNLIVTVVQSKTLDMSPLMVIVSVTVGTYLFGIAGGIISIPITGCIQVLVMEYLAIRKARVARVSGSPFKRVVSKIQGES